MLRKPPITCTYPGCTALSIDGHRRCEQHRWVRLPGHDDKRPSSRQRGYTRQWEIARAEYLRAHPLCECPQCQAGALRVRVATVVDHIIPHRGDQRLFWDRSNWQAMAKQCHDRKSARERITPRNGLPA